MICMSTDYDAWRDEAEPVTVETVIGNLTNNGRNANILASKIIVLNGQGNPRVHAYWRWAARIHQEIYLYQTRGYVQGNLRKTKILISKLLVMVAC